MYRLFLVVFAVMPIMMMAQKSETISLNENWQFSQVNDTVWYDAETPGSVQADLIRHGVLPDPIYGTNEKDIQWVEDEDWNYRKSFVVNADQLNHDDAYIFFEGLDTHADVFLNGSRILQTENMFVGHKVPVKKLLKMGENKLYIRFFSPIKRMMPARETFGFEYPVGNDHREEKLSVYNRKAPYHFGWDWGIRIVQMGIWKPISLNFYDKARIEDYYVKQSSVSSKNANIDNIIEIHSLDETNATIIFGYSLNKNKNISVPQTKEELLQLQSIGIDVALKKGENTFSLPTIIENPQLWMPVNWGEQHLYDFYAMVIIDDEVVAVKDVRTGLRTIGHIAKEDEHGKSYYFEVNGVPIFAKGSNYIPGEIFTHKQDAQFYNTIFDNITGANMNFVRVWGGGIYENEEFYRQADERGILVWQDFIFGCTTYPSDDFFLSNVKTEAIYNIKRLRNHASLAYWCGNNEVYEGLNYWGWHKDVTSEIMDQWAKGYDKTFRELLPTLVDEFDGTRSYVHGSPDLANWGRPELFNTGDVHDWGLWYGQLPFEALADRLPRFASEFGFQSFPEMKTIRTFAEPDQWALESEVMKVHQKASTGNSLIKKYMNMYYHEPNNFEDFVYLGLVMQGNGMEESVEAMRRGRPYCMGALYWQINDSWPVVSWSSIDYHNNWKTQHYRMRDVFAPLALGLESKDGNLNYYTMSDYLYDTNDLKLTVRVIDFSTGLKKEYTETINAKANDSRIVKTYNVSDLVSENEKVHTMINAFLTDSKGNKISQKDHFFYWPNKLELPETDINTSVKYDDGEYKVTLWSSKLAKDVFIEIPILGAQYSDNFIDLLPNEKVTITITSPQLKQDSKTPITVKHVRETYNK